MLSLKKILSSLIILIVISIVLMPKVNVSAQLDPLAFCEQDEFKTSDVCTQRTDEKSSSSIDSGKDGIFLRIVNLIIYLTASLSILMVVIGAFKYVISGGEGSQTKSAKDTILYALVGLFVAISSFAIVRFAISRI
jgi:hypothetical protein